MTSAPIDDLSTVLAAVGDVVAAVGPDQWTDPTPCPEWNVRQLVNHMVVGDRLFTGILRGEAAASPHALDPKDNDVLGDDPATAYRDAAHQLVAAFARPGALEGVYQVPAGTVPGIAALHLRLTETLVHGWDLAQAIGQQPPQVPGDIVERELQFSRSKLADVPPDRTPFGPPQPVPDDAPPLTRLAALLGRPGRRPPTGLMIDPAAVEAFEDLAAEFTQRPAVARRRMFGRDGLSRDGKFFVFLDRAGLVLKLPPATATALLQASQAVTAESVSPSMRKSWVLVPLADGGERWRALTAEAFDHVHA